MNKIKYEIDQKMLSSAEYLTKSKISNLKKKLESDLKTTDTNENNIETQVNKTHLFIYLN